MYSLVGPRHQAPISLQVPLERASTRCQDDIPDVAIHVSDFRQFCCIQDVATLLTALCHRTLPRFWKRTSLFLPRTVWFKAGTLSCYSSLLVAFLVAWTILEQRFQRFQSREVFDRTPTKNKCWWRWHPSAISPGNESRGKPMWLIYKKL